MITTQWIMTLFMGWICDPNYILPILDNFIIPMDAMESGASLHSLQAHHPPRCGWMGPQEALLEVRHSLQRGLSGALALILVQNLIGLRPVMPPRRNARPWKPIMRMPSEQAGIFLILRGSRHQNHLKQIPQVWARGS